jgi:hypothetical protein
MHAAIVEKQSWNVSHFLIISHSDGNIFTVGSIHPDAIAFVQHACFVHCLGCSSHPSLSNTSCRVHCSDWFAHLNDAVILFPWLLSSMMHWRSAIATSGFVL